MATDCPRFYRRSRGVTDLWSFLWGLSSRCCRWQVRSEMPWSWSLVGVSQFFAGIGMELLFHIWARVLEQLKWTAHFFQSFWRVRWNCVRFCFPLLCFLDRIFSSILSRSQASPAVTILGLQRQYKAILHSCRFFWMAGLLNEILKALTAREWSSGSPCQAGECFVGYSWEANTNRLDLLSLV